MKQLFFFAMVLVLPATIVIALLYSFAKYLYTLYEERRELKELDAIQAESAAAPRTKPLGEHPTAGQWLPARF